MTPNRTHRSGSPLPRGTAATLTAVCVYSVIVAGVLWGVDGLSTAVRLPLALPLLLVAPGYAVVAALFPASGTATRGATAEGSSRGLRSEESLSALERGILAVAASIAVVPMVALAMAAVVGVAVGPILVAVAGLTVVASGIAIVRAPAEEAIAVRRTDGSGESGRGRLGAALDALVTDRVTQIAFVLVAVLLVASAAVAFTGGPGEASTTEFYLVNETATSSDGGGSSTVAGDDPRVFDLRITHHGEQPQRYTVVVLIDGDDGSGSWTELGRSSTVVGAEETAGERVRVARSELAGPSTLRFLLYEGSAPQSPEPDTAHRTLKLSVDATDE